MPCNWLSKFASSSSIDGGQEIEDKNKIGKINDVYCIVMKNQVLKTLTNR